MIKVVHCISNFRIGGTELNMVRTLERLDRSEFDVRVVALQDDGPLRERISRLAIPIEVFSFARANSPLSTAARLISWLRRFAPDVVHCHDRYSNTFVVPQARLAGVPLVIASRRWWTAMPGGFYRTGNRLAYRLAHRVIANSPAVARLLVDEAVPAGRIVVVPNFVDQESFAELAPEAICEARRSFGIPEGAFVVTAVAILRPEKDLQSLIRAVGLLAPGHPDLHLLLVGSGPSEHALRDEAASAGLTDRVHFAGHLPQAPNPHQFGDLSVLCSLHEGFPNSIVEAMAAGKAVVATDVGGIPDAVSEGRTGLLVPPATPSALAAAIERLIGDRELRECMGNAAKAEARRAYRADTVITKLQSIYREAR